MALGSGYRIHSFVQVQTTEKTVIQFGKCWGKS